MNKIIPPAAAAAAIVAVAAGLTACSPHRLTRLECPAEFDNLTRTAQAADGQTCSYTSARGSVIDLRILQVKDTVDNALAPFQQAMAPPPAPPEPPAAGAKPAAKAAAKASSDDDGDDDGQDKDDKDETHVDLPGVHIDARGDSTNVTVAGMHIDADDGGGGAVIQSQRDVRLRGEQFSTVKRGFRASYMVASDRLPGGVKVMGYVAGGPKTGPIALALIKSPVIGSSDTLQGDAMRLVRRNGGV